MFDNLATSVDTRIQPYKHYNVLERFKKQSFYIMAVISRFSIQEIDDPTAQECRQWRGQLVASITSIPGYLPLHNTAMHGAGGGGGPPIAAVYPAGAAGVEVRTSVGILSAAAFAALKGNALRIICQQPAATIGAMIFSLGDEFDRQQAIDENTNMADFYREKYDGPRMGVRMWISEKCQRVLLCPTLTPVGARNGAVMFALAMLMPSAFGEVCNRARAEAGLAWQGVRGRLIDYDKANPRARREQQGRALVAQIQGRAEQGMNARIEQLEQQPPANRDPPATRGPPTVDDRRERGYLAPQFYGTCHKCKKWGHSAKFCKGKKVRKDDDKGGKKGGGKKGKGRGKGKGKGKGRGKW